MKCSFYRKTEKRKIGSGSRENEREKLFFKRKIVHEREEKDRAVPSVFDFSSALASMRSHAIASPQLGSGPSGRRQSSLKERRRTVASSKEYDLYIYRSFSRTIWLTYSHIIVPIR